MHIIYDLINYLDDILLQILMMILPEQISFLFDVLNTSTDVFSIISGMTPQQRSYFIKFLIDNNISLNSLFLYFEISLMFTTALICMYLYLTHRMRNCHSLIVYHIKQILSNYILYVAVRTTTALAAYYIYMIPDIFALYTVPY
ncbi:hypothetical protein HMPREF9454_02480 [Megamonas funiformis YIT 11815]|uniref:Uncharacterized protein n=1 Tax=Megamonas funiformis YIT 11815 TaxID=742816 RepID=A0ABP2NGL6_9FIRM|nr:hypothetical protein HMPREF9454_02480 [Megamonas funiformis YIT 11815]